ncbi:helix-turn-helix transcriptional regulator [Kiritimatiellota bacterium B12222]|nr:helix-turn-helix transcriptional regulator [Kiritimatiellota bacterium B12222]
MSYANHSVDQLGPPFRLSDEIIFLIPKAGKLTIKNQYHKLLLVLDGEAQFEIKGLEGRQTLKKGDIFFAPSRGNHHYYNAQKHQAAPLHVLRIFYDIPSKQTLRPENDFGDFIQQHFQQVGHLHDGIDAKLQGLIREFREETENRAPGFRHRLFAICTDLTIESVRKLRPHTLNATETDVSSGEQIVIAAREFIFKHYPNPLTLGEIAWHVGKGEEHLARLFKRHTGQSVFDTVREIRVDAAKTYLPNPSYSLTQIAEKCGFNSLAFFSRSFKQITGLSPSQYRAHSLNAQPVSPPTLNREE